MNDAAVAVISVFTVAVVFFSALAVENIYCSMCSLSLTALAVDMVTEVAVVNITAVAVVNVTAVVVNHDAKVMLQLQFSMLLHLSK